MRVPAHPWRVGPAYALGLLCVTSCGGGATDPPAEVWIFTGQRVVEDGCQLGTAALLDGKYERADRQDGGLSWTYQHGVTTNPAAPPPLACERSGAELACWPVKLPNLNPAPDYGTRTWVLTARLRGELADGDATLQGEVELFGTCPDGGWTCLDGQPSPQPTLPCSSLLEIQGAVPLPREPGECPAAGQGSTPGGAYATIILTNNTGEDFDLAWLDENGLRAGYTTVGSAQGPYNFYATVGTWYVMGENYADDDTCQAGFQVAQIEEYIVVEKLR